MSYLSEVLADSPLLWWRMESGGTDASGNSRPNATGTTGTVVTGILAGDPTSDAMQFNGSTQHLRENYDTWMAVSSFTVECWVKTAATTQQYLIARDNPTTDRIWALGHSLSGAAGKPYVVRLKNSSGTLTVDVAQGTTSINDGNPHHIVSTYDGTSLKIYVDGSLQATTAASGGLYAAPVWLDVASLADGSSLFYNGVLDEVAFYGTALSATRIAAHYTAGSTTPPKTGTLAATLSHPLTASLSGTYTPPTRTGTLSATLPHPLTASLSGSYTPPSLGTFAATLPKVTASLTGTYTPPPVPVGTFDAVLPFPTAEIAGTYTPPLRTGTLDATLPGLDAALSGTYLPLEVGTLDATLPTLTADLTGTYHALGETGTFAAVIPALTGAFVGTYDGATPTDLSNALDGLDLLLTATVTFAVPVAAPSSSLGVKYDKAIAYPVPTMVGGRPT